MLTRHAAARLRMLDPHLLGAGNVDVPEVGDLAADRREPLVQPPVANRRRPHVDAAAPGAQIQR